MRLWNEGRQAPAIAYSSARVMRSITGRFSFFDMCAGMAMVLYEEALEPKPPPQNSAM
ncbi:MAG: hypothetical protein U1E56_09400 [Bauldia sp.]